MAENQAGISHRQLCIALRNSVISSKKRKEQLSLLEGFVLGALNVSEPDPESVAELNIELKTFITHLMKRYIKAKRCYNKLLSNQKNEVFLSHHLILPDGLICSESGSPVRKKKRLKVGRPSVPFEEKSVRGRQQASAEVRQLHPPGAILMAASQQQTPVGKLIRLSNSPSGSTALRAIASISKEPVPGKNCSEFDRSLRS